MVLGPSAKNKKGGPVQVDYLIHIQEVKPWPPSQSLRSLRSVLIQWENGDRNSGSTEMVVPTLGSVIGEGKIEFNESIRLRTTLQRMAKGKDADAFQKNCVEFNLSESRRDNKTQVLATAVIDLADYGVVSEPISITAPMNCKRSFRNTSEPVLFIIIKPFDKRNRPSLRESMSKEELPEKNLGESVSALMNEEYAEEAEVASFTDDDISSHSSLTNGGLTPQNELTGADRPIDCKSRLNGDHNVNSKFENDKHSQRQDLKGSSSCSSSVDLSSELESTINGHASILNSIDSRSMSTLSNCENKEEEGNMAIGRNDHQDSSKEIDEKVDACTNDKANTSYVIPAKEAYSPDDDGIDDASAEGMDGKKSRYIDIPQIEDKNYSSEDQSLDIFPGITSRNGGLYESYTPSSDESYKNDRLRHVKSVRSTADSPRSNGMIGNRNNMKEIASIGEINQSPGYHKFIETKSAKIFPKDIRSTISDGKIQQLEHKIKMLEGELRETAAIEASLYSIVAEHGSSISKVHAPARRLSRLYLHACKDKLQLRRANAARTAVSGLVLVAKACGNDVPRLTFWLSNCVVLRAIISQTAKGLDIQHSTGSRSERNDLPMDYKTTSSSLKWKESSGIRKDKKNLLFRDFGDWESVQTFITALERVEAWIFARIVESIWWQTLTPHMQSAAAKEIEQIIDSTSRKSLGRTLSSSDQDQGNFSIDLWKEAFKDASERLCPVRAEGHECGCLPELARLVMEQCVARLDVAMFNAILCESEDGMPTDPVSDPISDLKVLPIPAGKSSFGAGAQLKNAIGNWSRWLTDLFGMDDDDDAIEDEDDERRDASFKSFHLLLALSDLMMLPKDMLLSKSIRKEVCPIFGAPLIKRVLDHFTPDEFCPDPIPDGVLQALESEDAFEDGEDSVTTVPCIAAPPIYLSPSADAIASSMGEFAGQPELRRSGSSVLRKAYTSDDELDELSSPLASIVLKSSQPSPGQTKSNWKRRDQSNQNTIRYELLRDVWLNSE